MSKFILNECNIRKIVVQVLKEVDSNVSTDYLDSYKSSIRLDSIYDYSGTDKKYIENTKNFQKFESASYDNKNKIITIEGNFKYQPNENIKKISVNLDSNSILGDNKNIFENINDIKGKNNLLFAIAFIDAVIENLNKEKEKIGIKNLKSAIEILEQKKKKIEINISKLVASASKSKDDKDKDDNQKSTASKSKDDKDKGSDQTTFVQPSKSGSVFPIPSSFNGRNIYVKLTSKPQKVRKLDIYKSKRAHRGADYGVIVNTPLVSISDGKVIMSKDRASEGSNGIGYVIVEYPGIQAVDNSPVYKEYDTPDRKGNLMVAYMHIRKAFVKTGDTVSAGQVIALSGGKKNDLGSGKSTGPHLHLGIGVRDKNHPFGDIFTKSGYPGKGGFIGSISGELYDSILNPAQKIDISDKDMPVNLKYNSKKYRYDVKEKSTSQPVSENKHLTKILKNMIFESKYIK